MKTEKVPKKFEKKIFSKVDFNINPGYDKPTKTEKATVKASYEYAMARTYPCYMTLHFAYHEFLRGLPPLVVEYRVSEDKKTARRIVLEVPRAGLQGRRAVRKPGSQIFEGDEGPVDGWVQLLKPGAAPKIWYCTPKNKSDL